MDEDRSRVHGRVSKPDGREVSRALVVIWWQRIRDRVELASGHASEDGEYDLSYRLPEEALGSPLIVVEARSPELEEPLESPATPSAPDLRIDLQPRLADTSELSSLLRVIKPQLGRLTLLDVVESDEHQDVTFLAAETQTSTEQIMAAVVAARLEAAHEIPAAVFYAFVRQRVPAALPSPLLQASQGFTLIDALVGRVGSLIVGLVPGVLTQTLETALQRNLIDPAIADTIPALVRRLHALHATNALDQPYLVGKTTLGQLLDHAGLDPSTQQSFAGALVNNTGSMRSFWRTLGDGQHGLSATEASTVQRTLEIGALVKNHLPLVSVLLARYTRGGYTSLADLARLSQQDWVQLVEQVGAPSNIDGAGDASPAEVFAAVVYTRVTRAYPTAALSSRIGGGTFIPDAEQAPLAQFFTTNGSLDLIRTNISGYLDNEGEQAFAGIAPQDRPAVVSNLKGLQRMLRVTATADNAETLLGLGLHSATQIANLGREQFFTRATAAGLTKPEATRTYQSAVQRYAAVVSLITQYRRDFLGPWPAGIGSLSDLDQPTNDAIQRDQSLATLFGSQDYCAVDDCTSVLSPAAYLCDLLLWLRNHPLTGPFPTALAALLDRRPDLGHLLLNCPNTDTALPYIDLVNELLADAVSPPMPPVWKQTTRTAAELRAAPEYVNGGAYTILAGASYPHTLPYDGPLDQLRTSLQQSGVGLWQLRQALLPVAGPSPAQRLSVAAERFGIDPHERNLITTVAMVSSQVAWNFISPVVAWSPSYPTVDPAPVPVFLHAAAISYEQLLALLEVSWVRGGGAPTQIQGIDDSCDTNLQTLTPLDDSRLDRAHRFLRLWRHTGWAMWELDLLVDAAAVGAGVLGADALDALFTFRRLQDATRLAVDEQLAWFQDLDTQSHLGPDGSRSASLYARLFLDPDVPPDDDLAQLAVGGPVARPLLSDHLPAVQAALQLSASETGALFALTDGQLTLANLSQICRVLTLARVVQLSLSDLAVAVPFTTAQTLGAALSTPASALEFIEQLAAVRQSGFTIDTLTYVLSTQPTNAGITQDQITSTVLPAVRSAIQRTHDEVSGGADSPMVILARELPQIPAFADPAVLTRAVSVVDDTYAGSLLDRTSLITATFGTFMDPATAQSDLAPLPGGLTDAQRQSAVDTRARQVLSSLATFLTQTRVIAALASNLILPSDVTALLATTLVLPASTVTALAALRDPSLITRVGTDYLPINATNYPDQYHGVELLDKVGTVVRRLHLVKDDLTWLLSNPSTYGGLDLADLPILNTQPTLTMAALLTTSLMVKLDRAFTAAPPGTPLKSLHELISAAAAATIPSDADAQIALSAITGWAAGDTTDLANATGVSLAAGNYSKPATYDALRTLAAMLAKTGGNGAQLVSWGVADPGQTEATSAYGVMKSRYANKDWLAVAPAMTDPIRERCSAALRSYLLAQRDGSGALLFGDTNALFDHFLIDVQMSSCEITTRIVQAYAAVQLFIERALMGLEQPKVTVDLTGDETWLQWSWMKRFRIWQANREVFLYPENWLVESQRPSRTEIFVKLEQEVHQGESTTEHLEKVALNYIDSLDEIAHLVVTGVCADPVTGTQVVARTADDPPRFYHRSMVDGAWSGWAQIPLDIKAHQAVPAMYRGRLCVFWLDVKVANEPRQSLPSAQPSSTPPSQDVARYVAVGLNFSIYRNGAWAPAQKGKGKLFDVPGLSSQSAGDSRSVEALYTLKVQTPLPSPGYGAALFLDVFRSGVLRTHNIFEHDVVDGVDTSAAVHLGRAVFDGRVSELELRDLLVPQGYWDVFWSQVPIAGQLLPHAQNTYGPDAQPLLPLGAADPDLIGEPGLTPQAGALATAPPNNSPTLPLTFTSIGALQQNVGTLLNTAAVPFRVVGPITDLAFDPSSDFFYQDNRRCYYVAGTRYYQWGSAWLPVPPSNADSSPYEVRYTFHRFYHPYTRLFWHQLSGGGFPALYNRALQLAPDTIDPTHSDVFTFGGTYHPLSPRVSWGEDNEIIDFAPDAAYSVYNWELFLHTPLYVAELLSQNQQFADALTWFHFIFNPTLQGPDPVPQRFWVPKPLNSLTTPLILAQRVNQLLQLVNQGDPDAVALVQRWRKDPFNPFLIADQRPVAYMKRVVMSYLDNLIAWADNLFSTDSREALNEATLLYVTAAEILGPQPVAITAPKHADDSFDDLEPKLDAFANALVDIENVVPGGGGAPPSDGTLPVPQTFYFKVPPNDKLLGYWSTIADRLFKLRHCQNIEGVTRQLALFDAPIDPGLLIRAQAAGVDLGSVLSDLQAPLPNYRFSVLQAQATDFCDAVRRYGKQLLAALEKQDAEAMAMLLATSRQQLLQDADAIFASRVEQAQQQINALEQTLLLAQARYDDANQSAHQFANAAESTALGLKGALVAVNAAVAIGYLIAGGLHAIPQFTLGVAGFGGSPSADAGEGGHNAGSAADSASDAGKALATALDKGSDLAKMIGDFMQRQDDNTEKAKESQIQIAQTQAQIAGAQVALDITAQQRTLHTAREDRLQAQIDYMTAKFTSQDLYDWMVSQLSDTYFQSYRLAYRLCQQTERSYRYELGVAESSFIQFGYWDNLKKGLLAGERLEHDLRRLRASYLDQNARRFEISRHVSLAALDQMALRALLTNGACDFDLPESLFDRDYPGHYQRHLVRMALTVVYPDPGRFDNVMGTLTLTRNSVRTTTDLATGYPRQAGTDHRFTDQYAAVPQKIVLGNGQDDPGLFVTSLTDNLADPRYLPFEGAGAISSWHLEVPAASNEIDLASVGDVVLHLHYTAVDGGDALKQVVQAANAASLPTSGAALFSARNDFGASGSTGTPWDRFISTPATSADQSLVLNLTPGRFPSWTRGKNITVTAISILAVSWAGGDFVAQPQAPLPSAPLTLTPIAVGSGPQVAVGTLAVPGVEPGVWTLKLRSHMAPDFRSLTANDIGDVLILVTFDAN